MSLIKIIDEQTKKCEVALNENPDAETIAYFSSLGYIEGEWERGYDGVPYVKGFAPRPSVEYQNEQIRIQRQARFTAESDPLKLDYDEALARDEETAEEKKQAWLDKKTQIREELPYVVEDVKNTKKRKKASN